MPRLILTMTHGYSGMLPGNSLVNYTTTRTISCDIASGAETVGVEQAQAMLANTLKEEQTTGILNNLAISSALQPCVIQQLHIITAAFQIVPDLQS